MSLRPETQQPATFQCQWIQIHMHVPVEMKHKWVKVLFDTTISTAANVDRYL